MEEKQSFQEFKQQVTRTGVYNHKVKDSVGVYDMYKKIRKNHWYNIGRPVTEKEFYAIIRGINKLLAEEVALGNTVKFPERMGMLELHKYQAGAGFSDGKLKIPYPVDWNQTLLFWYDNPEARKQKILLRNESPWIYHVKYIKRDATYENKIFYQFKLNTFIRKKLGKNIKQGKIDTIW